MRTPASLVAQTPSVMKHDLPKRRPQRWRQTRDLGGLERWQRKPHFPPVEQVHRERRPAVCIPAVRKPGSVRTGICLIRGGFGEPRPKKQKKPKGRRPGGIVREVVLASGGSLCSEDWVSHRSGVRRL